MVKASLGEERAWTRTTPLIERDMELGAATETLRLAAAGQGSALLFEGAGGSGKTALLEALVAEAVPFGLLPLSATGRELEQDLALGVVLQLLEPPVSSDPDHEHGPLFAGAARQALPLFASGPRQALFDPPALLHGLFRLCANLASSERPLLLAVDDVDLADEPSLRFLLYLIERLDTVPLVLALAAGGSAGSELVERIVTHPRVRRHQLATLSGAGTAQRLRTAWLPAADDAVCAAVHGASGGNPGLVDELGAELRSQNHGREITADAVLGLAPLSVAAKALARARAVGRDGPALLQAVAVLGSGCELRHAAAVAGLEPAEAIRVVDGLVVAGLLTHDGTLGVRHPVVAEAIRAEQQPAERAAANLRAAEALVAEEASPERVASHLLDAPRAGSGWAVASLCSAAEVALGRGAPADAVQYLRRALDEPPPREMRAHVLLELGRAEATAGDPAALTRLGEAIDRVPDAGERAQRALESGRNLFVMGRPQDALDAFARGLGEVGSQDGDLARRLSSAHRAVSWVCSPASVTIPPSTAEAEDGSFDRAACALAAFDAAARCAPYGKVHELAVRALDRGALLDDDTADGIAYYFAAAALIAAEDLQTAEAALTAAIEDARARGSVLGFATASVVRSLAIGRRGRVGDAAADARLALAAERHGWRVGSAGARALLAAYLVETGDLDGAERHIVAVEQGSDERNPAWTSLLLRRGELRLARGDAQRALADFRTCGERLATAGIENPALLPWRSVAARAHAALGERDRALELAAEELELARAFGAPGTVGASLRTYGVLTGGRDGIELLEAAVAQLEESQLALERARALAEFGAALRRLGRRAAAREPLRRAVDLAQRCGAEQLAARALQEARLAGAKPRRTALYGLEALTPRERETAELAAQGMANKEIAEALFVTVKTVEWHLKHSYRKLGVRTRRDLAELMHDR